MSSSSDVSTKYASDASLESNADSSNGKSQRKSQQLTGVTDSGFVTRDPNGSDTDFISSSSSPPSNNGGSSPNTVVSSASIESSSTKRARKNPSPKRRLKATEEIAHLQNSTHLVIPRAAFQRIVRETVNDINENLLIQKEAYEALQESAEMYLVQTFEDAVLLTEHRRCITVEPKDLKLVQRMQTPALRSQPIANANKDDKSANNANATDSEEENANNVNASDSNGESEKSD